MTNKFAIALLTVTGAAFAATSASAADLPRKGKRKPVVQQTYAPVAPVAAVPMARSWTGPYAGVQAGYGWGKGRQGILGGAHAGYNMQVSPSMVVGVEGDVEVTDIKGNTYYPGVTARRTTPVQGSLRARVGVLPNDRTMIYATAGGAAAQIRSAYSNAAGTETFSNGRVGYTVGAGIEHAATDSMTIRAEYRYTDYGKITNVSSAVSPGTAFTQRADDHSVRMGVSYRF